MEARPSNRPKAPSRSASPGAAQPPGKKNRAQAPSRSDKPKPPKQNEAHAQPLLVTPSSPLAPIGMASNAGNSSADWLLKLGEDIYKQMTSAQSEASPSLKSPEETEVDPVSISDASDEQLLKKKKALPQSQEELFFQAGLIFTTPYVHDGRVEFRREALAGKKLKVLLAGLTDHEKAKRLLQLGEELEAISFDKNRKIVGFQGTTRQLLSQLIPGWNELEGTVDAELAAETSGMTEGERQQHNHRQLITDILLRTMLLNPYKPTAHGASHAMGWLNELSPQGLEDELAEHPKQLAKVVSHLAARDFNGYKDFLKDRIGIHSSLYPTFGAKDTLQLKGHVTQLLRSHPNVLSGFVADQLVSHPVEYVHFLRSVVEALYGNESTDEPDAAFTSRAIGGLPRYLVPHELSTNAPVDNNASEVAKITSELRSQLFDQLSGGRRAARGKTTVAESKDARRYVSLYDSGDSPASGVKLLRSVDDFSSFLLSHNKHALKHSRMDSAKWALFGTMRIRWFNPDGLATPWVSGNNLIRYYDYLDAENSGSKPNRIRDLFHSMSAMGPYVEMEMYDGAKAVGLSPTLLQSVFGKDHYNWRDWWRRGRLERRAVEHTLKARASASKEPMPPHAVQQYFFDQFMRAS
jgi:hypothetical protein